MALGIPRQDSSGVGGALGVPGRTSGGGFTGGPFGNPISSPKPTYSRAPSSYGPSVPDSAHISNPLYTLNPQQRATLDWFQSTTGLNQMDYNAALGQITAQQNAAQAGFQSAVSGANKQYGIAREGHGLDVRGINENLWFGTQLRNEDKYRNVYIARKRSRAGFRKAKRMYLTNRRELKRQRAFALRGYAGDRDTAKAEYRTNIRELGSDAMARGARTAAGTHARSRDIGEGRGRAIEKARLAYDTAMSGITASEARERHQFVHARAQYGLDLKTFRSLEKTYGIQAAQATAQAKLAKDKAALALRNASVARDNAVSRAAAARSQALAGLTGARTQAQTSYGRSQMQALQQFMSMM